MRRTYTRAVIVLLGSLAFGVAGSGAARPAVAYPEPPQLPAVTAATVDERYLATQQAVSDALSVAQAAGDQRRAATLASFAGRNLLEFDGRDNGRVVEVIGDLAGADRIAVVVPGSHTTLDTFDRPRGPGGGARALAEEIRTLAPGARIATVAWLGYDPPQGAGPDSLTDRLARPGADALHATVSALHGVNPAAPISLLCHSYGSIVCAYAAGADLPVADLVMYGSPGVGVASAADLATRAQVWAGRAADDWIRFVPFVRLAGIGFGPDPAGPDFGALPFPAGDRGHGDYHLPGGESLRSLALIALGTMEVPGG